MRSCYLEGSVYGSDAGEDAESEDGQGKKVHDDHTCVNKIAEVNKC